MSSAYHSPLGEVLSGSAPDEHGRVGEATGVSLLPFHRMYFEVQCTLRHRAVNQSLIFGACRHSKVLNRCPRVLIIEREAQMKTHEHCDFGSKSPRDRPDSCVNITTITNVLVTGCGSVENMQRIQTMELSKTALKSHGGVG